MSVRLSATRVLTAILKHDGSLATSLPAQLEKLPESEHSLLRQLCYGSMRYYPQLQLLAEQLISKPLKRKDLDVQGPGTAGTLSAGLSADSRPMPRSAKPCRLTGQA